MTEQMTDDSDIESGGGPERLVTLVDAVVAIAMTLLALDLRPALGEHVSSRELADYFRHNTGEYLAFGLAFVIIAQYWVTHHRMMRSVRRNDAALMWSTMLFLFGITLLPLTSYLTGSYNAPLAATIFAGSLVLLSVSLTLMSEVISRHGLRDRPLTAATRRRARYREVTTILIPLSVAVLTWFIPHASYLFALFILADLPGRLATRHSGLSHDDARSVR